MNEEEKSRSDRLLTPGEVAKIFRVCKKTPGRWAHAGKIDLIRTPGGHHRFWESQIRALLVTETLNQEEF